MYIADNYTVFLLDNSLQFGVHRIRHFLLSMRNNCHQIGAYFAEHTVYSYMSSSGGGARFLDPYKFGNDSEHLNISCRLRRGNFQNQNALICRIQVNDQDCID